MKLSRIILIFLFFFSSFVICFGQQLPEFFGVYIVSNGQLIELKENNIKFKFPNKGGMQVDCMGGLNKLSNIDFNDTKGYLIIFLENIDINSINLSKLRYVNTEPLTSFPIIGDPENVMTYINMWVKEKDVPFKKGPIEGKKGMYKIAPISGFEPGVYALHQGGIRRMRTQTLAVQMLALDRGNTTAFDFSFNLGKAMNENSAAKEPEGTETTPNNNTETKAPLPKKPAIEATEANLKHLLNIALEMISERTYVTPSPKIRGQKNKSLACLDRAIDVLNQAGEISKIINIDSLSINNIQDWLKSIKEVKELFAMDSNLKSYNIQRKIGKEIKQYLQGK